MSATPTLILLEATPVWAYLHATIIASGLIGALITLWLNRGKPKADIHESRARAAKDWAEADEIRIRANFSLEEETIHRTQQMIRAQRHIFELQEKVRKLEDENRFLKGRKQVGGQR